jgi:hypothetical protein
MIVLLAGIRLSRSQCEAVDWVPTDSKTARVSSLDKNTDIFPSLL